MSTAKLSYFDMAAEAIAALKDRTGSSGVAITKFITSKYPKLAFAPVSHFVCVELKLLYFWLLSSLRCV